MRLKNEGLLTQNLQRFWDLYLLGIKKKMQNRYMKI